MEKVVELDWGNHNRPVNVVPTGLDYRSRWRFAFEGQKATPGVSMPAEVPGIRIGIDSAARRVRIFDPLQPEDADAFRRGYGRHLTPMETVKFENLSEADLKAWMDWQRVAVMYDVARMVQPHEAG